MATTAPAPAPAAATPPPLPRQRARYTRLETLGLLLTALAPATMLVAALVAGLSIGEEVPFFAVMIVVPLIAAALVWRFGTWAKVLGIVVALAAGFMLFWVAFGVAYPSSPGDFVPAVIFPLGVLLAVGAGIAAVVQQRRHHFDAAMTSTERRIGGAVLGLIVVALVVSAGMLLLNRTAAGAAGEVSVVMSDFEFDQDAYTVTAGETTTLVARNTDPFMHTFTIPELGIHEMVAPGNEVAIDITADAGTYTLYCEPHSDTTEPDPEQAGMAASLIVE